MEMSFHIGDVSQLEGRCAIGNVVAQNVVAQLGMSLMHNHEKAHSGTLHYYAMLGPPESRGFGGSGIR